MRWQRVARWFFAAAGIACLAALAWQFHQRAAPVVVSPPAKHDPAATVEGGAGQQLEWGKDGQEQWKIQFGSMASYPDDRFVFKQAHFTSLHANKPFEIWADEADTKGKGARAAGPADVKLVGHVHVTTSDHWTIQTDQATYADATGILTMPGAMTFARDRMTGEGEGATYDRFNGVLNILDKAHFVATADEQGAGALDASATHMTMTRPQKSAHLDGATRLVRDKETLAADTQAILFTDDEKGLKQLDMQGHASVIPKPDVDDAPPDMRADTIGLWLHPDGRTLQHATLRGKATVQLTSTTGAKTIAAPAVDLQLAKDGQTVTGLDGHDGVTVHLPPTADTPSARTITAQTLISTGDEKEGLKTALFTGGTVSYREVVPASGTTPASTRTATSKALALKLNGDLGAVDEAEFRQTVKFQDGDVTADAEHATYAEAKNLLILDQATKDAQPIVVNGSVTVHGDVVHLATDSHDVDAKGKVQTKTNPSTPANGAKAASPGLFDGDQPTYGSSNTLHYESGPQRATYTGTDADLAEVRQTQNRNDVRADTIVVEQQTNNLHATGHVASVFASDPKPTGSASGKKGSATPAPAAPGATSEPSVYHASAQELVYTDDNRLAHYIGGDLAQLQGPDGTTTAHIIDVTLAKESRTVDRMVADGTVHLTSETKREGVGDHLTYEAASDIYHLTGTPAKAVLPQAQPASSQQAPKCMFYSAKSLTFAGGGFAAASSNGEVVQSQEWPCGTPIPPTVK